MIRLENVLKTSLLDVSRMSWRCPVDVSKTSWRRLEDFLKTFLRDVLKTFWGRLEDILAKRLEDILAIRLEDVLETRLGNTSWRCLGRLLEDVYKTSCRRFEFVLKTFLYRFKYIINFTLVNNCFCFWNRLKGFIRVALHDFVQSLFGVCMFVRTHTNAC